MNAVNPVQLFLLVWGFSTVCHGDTGVCSVSCDDVNGTVGKEVTLTCRVSEQCNEDCIQMFKFQYPENHKTPVICKESPNGVCEKRNFLTCSYTPDTAMKGIFSVFLQAKRSQKSAKFTVEISGLMKSTAVTPSKEEENGYADASKTRKEEKQDRGFKLAVILSVVSCFIIVIIVVTFKIRKSKSTHLRLGCEENKSTCSECV